MLTMIKRMKKGKKRKKRISDDDDDISRLDGPKGGFRTCHTEGARVSGVS